MAFSSSVSFVKLLPELLDTNRINVAKISFKKKHHQMEYSFLKKIKSRLKYILCIKNNNYTTAI